MTSRYKEIVEAIECLAFLETVGCVTSNSGIEKHYKVTYGKLDILNNVIAIEEQINGHAESRLLKDALKKGYRTDDEILIFLEKVHNDALKKARETGENQYCDVIGPLRCQEPTEECDRDFVNEVATPDGRILYIRHHTW